MQKILETKYTTDEIILADIQKGGRFVQFQYVNLLPNYWAILPTNIYFVPSDTKAIRYGWPYLLLCLFLGLGIGLLGYRQRNVTGFILKEHDSAVNSRGLNRTLKDTLWHVNESIDNSPLAH